MKEIYIQPETLVSKIETTSICQASMSLSTTAAKNGSVGLGRERGSRSESDDFDELW